MKKITKKDILTIPNFLSFFRLLLIPVILWLYCVQKNYNAAIVVIALSAATDLADGRIARKYNMVSDVGIVLDPIADKLTQAALVGCLIPRYRMLWLVMGLLICKELFMLISGLVVLRKTGEVNGARWYGKLNTTALYSVMMLLILIPDFPLPWANALILICSAIQIMTGILYGVFYCGILREKKSGGSRKAD